MRRIPKTASHVTELDKLVITLLLDDAQANLNDLDGARCVDECIEPLRRYLERIGACLER